MQRGTIVGYTIGTIRRGTLKEHESGIGALMGHPLFPLAGQWWARGARTLRSADMFDVGAWVGMRLRAETENTWEAA